MKEALLAAKLHRATVSATELGYVCSIGVETPVLSKADILPFERAKIVNLTTASGGTDTPSLRTRMAATSAPPGEAPVRANGPTWAS
jgi:Aspartate decarboxylase